MCVLLMQDEVYFLMTFLETGDMFAGWASLLMQYIFPTDYLCKLTTP